MKISSEKTKKLIADFLKYNFNGGMAITQIKCMICDKPATKFRDELSKKEYRISGLCQECQDEIFKK